MRKRILIKLALWLLKKIPTSEVADKQSFNMAVSWLKDESCLKPTKDQ